MARWATILAAVVAAGTAWAGPDGRIAVVDGDTLRVGGETVRLFAVDAPELDQTCRRPDGEVWPCGDWARREVRRLFEGQRARCEAVDVDQYGRTVAICTVDGYDIGGTLVANGYARAYLRYSDLYLDTEKAAVVAGRGIFGSDMAAPEDHRAADRPPPQVAPGACAIKGNISDSGHIYHVPGQENYADTQINERRGERWFCTEAEARAAGWRPARR